MTKVSEISIPPAWLATYPVIFRPFQTSSDGSFKSITLCTVEDVTLTEVILTAKHEDAYAVASVYGGVLEDWFFESQVIIRAGEEVFIPPSVFSACGLSIQFTSSLFGYTVNLALPHKQGIAQRGLTRFIVTSTEEARTEISDGCVSHESLEINESFLVSAVLSSPELFSQANDRGECLAALLCV